MSEIIIITPEQLESIIDRCLQKISAQSTPETKPTKHLHSIVELAEFLNCSVVTAHKLKKSGAISFVQYGRKCIFSTSQVLEDLAKVKFKNK